MRNNQTLKTLLDLNTLSENVNIEDIGPILPNVLELCQMPLPEETLHIAYLLVVKYLEQYPRYGCKIGRVFYILPTLYSCFQFICRYCPHCTYVSLPSNTCSETNSFQICLHHLSLLQWYVLILKRQN